MPSTERFRARPMWACLEPCPLREITSFVEDSSRSRKSVFLLCSHKNFWNKELNQNQASPARRISLPKIAEKGRL
jgi:hypothetical protein